MWHKLNLALRRSMPGFHKQLKQVTHQWRTSESPLFPIPSFVPGHFTLLHPSFLTYKTYEPLVQAQIKTHLKPGDAFIDVGANCGLHTLLAAKLVGKQGQVLAFEPSKANLNMLEYHRRINLFQQVSIYPDALGHEVNKTVDFVLVDGGFHSSNSLTIKEDVPHISKEQKQVIQVSMTTIDHICQQEKIRPKLIKIDVEGAELFVLEGTRKTLEEVRPIILLGLHPFWMPKEHSPEAVNQLFKELNYTVRSIDNQPVSEFVYGDYIVYPNESSYLT